MNVNGLDGFPANSLENFQEATVHLLNKRALYIENPENQDWIINDPVLYFLTPVLFFLHKKKRIVLQESFCQQAENVYFSNKARWVIGEHRLRQILQTLYDAGIEVIPLKGAILQSLLYRDNGLRPMADIDILVQSCDFLRAAELLSQFGLNFVQRNKSGLETLVHLSATELPGELTFYDGHGFGIDLHQTLMPSNWYSALYHVNMQAVWDRSILLSESQQATAMVGEGLWKRLLSPYDLLAHLCLHSALHGLQNTKSYLDVDIWVRNLPVAWDWDFFVEVVNQWHVRSAVYHLILICVTLFATPVPVDVLAKLDPGWLARWRVRCLISTQSILSGQPSLGGRYPTLVKLTLADSLGKIITALAKVAFPPKPTHSKHYSQGGLWAHWLHIFEVIRRGD